MKRSATVMSESGAKRRQLTGPMSYKRALARSAALRYPGRYTSGGGVELKFFDTALSFTIDATGEVPATGQLVLIPQNTTESGRIGRKCVIKSIQLRANVRFAPAAAATAATTVFIYLVQDTQANGAAAGATDVFESADFPVTLLNLNNSQRFRILKRFKFTLIPTAGATTAYNEVTEHLEYFGRCNIPLEFSAAAGAITELRSNNIFLMAGSDGGSDDTVTVAGNCRVRFSDGS